MLPRLAIVALVCAVARLAAAQVVTREALVQAQTHGSLDELEALGAQRPITPWTDDAWRSAALLAERAHDLDRARRDLAQVVATAGDDMTRDRARADVARLSAMTGPSTRWGTTAARHAELAGSIRENRGDPTPALRELESLVRDNPGYPGAPAAALVIAAGWERDGAADRALEWLRTAIAAATTPADRTHAQAELVRALTRLDRLDEARGAIAPIGDVVLACDLTSRIDRAERRHWIRRAMIAIEVTLAALAALMLGRRGGVRRLRRPPAEAIYYLPIAALLAIVSQTGNPLVARAVIAIGLIGVVVTWVSGALLSGAPVRLRTVIAHGLCVTAAILAAAYLVLDGERMLDLVIETWRGGPAMR
jgi:hypothetical protein